MAEKISTADGYRPIEVHLMSLGVPYLRGAAEHQREAGNHWVRRAGSCFIPNCRGCSECSVHVQPYKDALAWLDRYIGSFGIYGQERQLLIAEIMAKAT